MQRCHLDKKTEDSFGYQFFRVNNDVNGNPRYVTHWLAFDNDYDQALLIAKSLGFSVYRGKDFGGGFVSQSYNLENTAEEIVSRRSEQNAR